MSEPSAPIRPQLAVSAAIFQNDRLLLVRRARKPALGVWTLPGGRVEFGESLHQALNREVQEETGLTIDIAGLAGYREGLPRPDRGQPGHYVILPFAAHWLSGDVNLNDELDDFRWIAPDGLEDFKTTEGLAEIVASACRLIGL